MYSYNQYVNVKNYLLLLSCNPVDLKYSLSFFKTENFEEQAMTKASFEHNIINMKAYHINKNNKTIIPYCL